MAHVDQNLNILQQKLDELAISLRVPDEISSLDLETELNNPGLTKYRPYFKAKAEYIEVVRFRQILDLKLQAERIEAKVAAAGAPSQ